MASYTYKEITSALLASGFVEEKNNNGSHQIFVHPKTGLAQPVPKHSNGMVASGTAEAILDYAVLSARVCNINIASDRYKLSNNVIEYIKKQHQKIKSDFKQIIPPMVRKQCGLESEKDVVDYVKNLTFIARKQQENKKGVCKV